MVRHLHVVRLELARAAIHAQHLFACLNACVSRKQYGLAAQRDAEDQGRIIGHVMIELAVGRVVEFKVRSSHVHLVTARNDAALVCDQGQNAVQLGSGIIQILARDKLRRGEIIVNLLNVQGIGVAFHQLDKAADVVVVGVGQNPRVHARLIKTRQPLQILYKVGHILRPAAVNDDNLVVLGGDDEAHHLNVGDGF